MRCPPHLPISRGQFHLILSRLKALGHFDTVRFWAVEKS